MPCTRHLPTSAGARGELPAAHHTVRRGEKRKAGACTWTLHRVPARRPTLPADHAAEEASMGTVQLELLNTKDFVAAGFTAAIVPLGACESHGDHMPFGTDGITSHALAVRVAEQLESTVVLPPNYL